MEHRHSKLTYRRNYPCRLLSCILTCTYIHTPSVIKVGIKYRSWPVHRDGLTFTTRYILWFTFKTEYPFFWVVYTTLFFFHSWLKILFDSFVNHYSYRTSVFLYFNVHGPKLGVFGMDFLSSRFVYINIYICSLFYALLKITNDLFSLFRLSSHYPNLWAYVETFPRRTQLWVPVPYVQFLGLIQTIISPRPRLVWTWREGSSQNTYSENTLIPILFDLYRRIHRSSFTRLYPI